MRWWIWVIIGIAGFLGVLKLVEVVASLALNPWRKRIREGFVSGLLALRPKMKLVRIHRKYLLIQTPSSLTRFELEGLYTDVMNAKPHTQERIGEITGNYMSGLLRIIDGNVAPKQTETGKP